MIFHEFPISKQDLLLFENGLDAVTRYCLKFFGIVDRHTLLFRSPYNCLAEGVLRANFRYCGVSENLAFSEFWKSNHFREGRGSVGRSPCRIRPLYLLMIRRPPRSTHFGQSSSIRQ